MNVITKLAYVSTNRMQDDHAIKNFQNNCEMFLPHKCHFHLPYICIF
jgi:hypothetical protein